MDNWQLQTPVCLIIFRRPDLTEKVFDAIRQVKPSKLLVIADGPRPDKLDEAELCAATRQIIDRVDWDCEVLKNYADVNMGLKKRVASGLDWVFENVEEAIIFEDDCLPDPSFFRFCEELLNYHRDNEQVMVITGTNFLFGLKPTSYSYFFSRYIDCWGWATWKRAWQHFDYEMKLWPKIRDNNELAEMLQDPEAVAQWTRIFQATYEGQINSWAFRWKLACWIQKGLTIIPEVNLVSNIGFNTEATNTQSVGDLLADTPVESIAFPLRHPPVAIASEQADDFIQKVVFGTKPSELRVQMAKLWLNLSPEELEQISLQQTIVRVLSCRTRNEPVTDAEQEFIQELMNAMSVEVEDPKALQYLLVAMLYTYPHHLPIQYDLARIPQWLVKDYLKFTLDRPRLFKDIGEAEQYYHYLLRWVNHLHANIVGQPDSHSWQEVALLFTQNANFSPCYLTAANLKDIYKKRAEIIELTLRSQGYILEYDFSERLPERNKIRIGLLAEHYGIGSESISSLPIYKHLNRDRFEIVLYSLYTKGDRLERYCSGHADAGVQLPDDLASQVQAIREEDLDILLITTQIAAEVNPITLLAAHRLARVQMVTMHSPVTTGLQQVDYYISGQLTERNPEAKSDYTEKLITLDNLGLCVDYGTEIQVLPTRLVTRPELNIPADVIIYASGTPVAEITPELEDLWMNILKNVPNSKLLLYPFNSGQISPLTIQAFQQQIDRVLAKHGLSEKIILINTALTRADTKEVLGLADIYLDSYPYSRITNLIEPLEMGLPIVTWEDAQARSRIGASLLRELQVPTLIADRQDTYLQIAVKLGTDEEFRQLQSEKIKHSMQNNPQFLDSYAYSKSMETLFRDLFDRQQGETLDERLRLREINLIVFPDWNQSEELLLPDLAGAIANLAIHPDKERMTLLIDTTNISDEDADSALSSIVLNLLMEEGLDIADGLEICLTGQLNPMQWQALIERLNSRIPIQHENQEKITQIKANILPTYSEII